MTATGFMFFGYSFRGNARLKLTIPTMVVLMEESGVSLRSHDMRRGRQHDNEKSLRVSGRRSFGSGRLKCIIDSVVVWQENRVLRWAANDNKGGS